MKKPHISEHIFTDYLSSSDCHNRKHLSNKTNHTYPLSESREYLLSLLLALDGVIQSSKYHPESDALYHTLQVFEWAFNESDDPELWLAALFHDIGKSVDSKYHCEVGEKMVSCLFSERVVWLIAHHLDLMKFPKKTKQRLANTRQLNDLECLRKWDLAGRDPFADVRGPEEALDITLNAIEKNKYF